MKPKILNILKVAVIFLLPVGFYAQSGSSLSDFALRKHRLNQKGIRVLAVWASANIVSGAGYFASGDRQEKYFYAMNAGWGLVNLAIAVPGLLAGPKTPSSKIDMLKMQTSTEKTFLVNAALDLMYITGGFLLREVAANQTNANRRDMFYGFGNSFLVQGAALLVFDFTMLRLNVKNRIKNLDPLLNNTQISLRGAGLSIKHSF